MNRKYFPTPSFLYIIPFVLFWIPFFFLIDIYPFLRLGMFAESHQYTTKNRIVFRLTLQNKLLESESVGLGKEHLEAIAKSYYYQGKSLQLLQILRKSIGTYQEIALLKVEGIDTTLVAKLLPK
jgi:hypothetical protein